MAAKTTLAKYGIQRGAHLVWQSQGIQVITYVPGTDLTQLESI